MCYIPAGLNTSSSMVKGAQSAAPTSLFSGVPEQTNAVLGVSNYLREPDASTLQANPPGSTAAGALVQIVYETIAANFRRIPGRPGKQNWRKYQPKVAYSDENDSTEVLLERRLVRACTAAKRIDWWNQVPVVSGLFGPRSGRRCAIDLVHERSPEAFDFVELKVESNTVVYATVEILQYGFAWLLSRTDKAMKALGYPKGTLLDGRDVALSVLAPARFYGGADWRAFAAGIDRSLRDIAQAQDVTMSFRLEHFRNGFDPDATYTDPELCDLLDHRIVN